MPLTICPECNRKISTRSEHCIFCGCPALFFANGEFCQPDVEPDARPNVTKPDHKPEMLSIRDAAARINFSEYALRGMVKRHEIPFIQSGKKVYINLDNLKKFLEQ